ncbi:MAG TPA: PqqD family peptide modification chaperone [Armatimonadota bacterium]|nr:PqqD family peptide modification chaperone [Armatimonadota bacterium]
METMMASALTSQSTVVAVTEQVSCEIDGAAVILGLPRGIYYSLDPVGSRIWSLIQQPRTVSEVRDSLLADYEVEPEQCETDLLALLGKLQAEGLIQVTGAAA